jgi:hypothetical protein
MVQHVTVVGRQTEVDLYRYTIVDAEHRAHTVEIPFSILVVQPRDYSRGTDNEHLDMIARGTVLMRTDPEDNFHKVDRSMVNRAYAAVTRAELSGSVVMY